MDRGRGRACLGIVALLLALTGCASSQVAVTSPYTGGPLARPDRVIVVPFTAMAGDVRLDQGIGARAMRAIEQEPANQAELQAARRAQEALLAGLVRALRARGLPAEAGQAEYAIGNAMLVQGQIVGLNEGNRARRELIGFGAGQGSITSEVQLFYVAGRSAPQFLESFEATASGPRSPGLASPLRVAGRRGPGAIMEGAVHGVSELGWAASYLEAERLAEAVAQRIIGFAAGQGWIPPLN